MAMARPMPEPAPVTATFLPSRKPATARLLFCSISYRSVAKRGHDSRPTLRTAARARPSPLRLDAMTRERTIGTLGRRRRHRHRLDGRVWARRSLACSSPKARRWWSPGATASGARPSPPTLRADRWRGDVRAGRPQRRGRRPRADRHDHRALRRAARAGQQRGVARDHRPRRQGRRRQQRRLGGDAARQRARRGVAAAKVDPADARAAAADRSSTSRRGPPNEPRPAWPPTPRARAR